MNKLIKHIAEQAGSTHKQSLGVYQFYSGELEKFAELIIAEACNAMANMPRYARTELLKQIEDATIEDCIATVENRFRSGE